MDLQLLAASPLFKGTPPKELEAVLDCLAAKEKRYKKGAVIYHAGSPVRSLGMVLSGRVQVESDDLWGNKSVLDSIGPGLVFAETYACIPGEPMMVSVVAAEAAQILFLDVRRALDSGADGCACQGWLIRNLLMICAQKNLNLSRKIFHTSSKTIRGRLLSYLSFQAAKTGSSDFTIPFDRQQLADYLSVDRSALSGELSRMRRDGLLEVNRNHFFLKGGQFTV